MDFQVKPNRLSQNATSQEQSHPDQSPPLLVALGVFPVPPVSVSWGGHRRYRRRSRGTWTHPSRRGLVVAAPGWLVAPDQSDQAAFGSSLVRNGRFKGTTCGSNKESPVITLGILAHLVRWWLGCIITSSERYLGSITILRRWWDP